MSAFGENHAAAPRLAIHIGLKKSGSATLQTFFHHNADALRANGIDYPVIGRSDTKEHHNFQREVRGRTNWDESRGRISEFVQYLSDSPHPLTVLSSEMFESLDAGQVQTFRGKLGGVRQPISIVIIIRNLLDLIASSYAQKVRYGQKNHDFDAFFAKRMAETRVSYFTTAEKWAEAFGWESIKVRILDPGFLLNGDLIDDFLAAVGVDPDAPAVRSLPRPGVVNSASDWRVLEAVRALYCRKPPLPDGHRLRAILPHATTLARRKRIEEAAIEAGRERGWQGDKGRYLNREQAGAVLDIYRESIVALNGRLAERLPVPPDLAASGFVDRSFLPKIAHIPHPELMGFYQEVAERLDQDSRMAEPAPESQEPRRELRAVVGFAPDRFLEAEAPGVARRFAQHDEDHDDVAEERRREKSARPKFSGSPEVRRISDSVAGVLRRQGREAALRHAMRAIEPLLETPSDTLRHDLRRKVFTRFSSLGDSYQGNDFESVDYQLYELAPDLPLFRGPAAPAAALERGDYFCVVGAAQTFGRLVAEPWPSLLGEAVGLPVLNLSRAGAGPGLFLAPPLLRLIQNARFIILQVMSGRSVGDAEFPGGRRIEGNPEFEGANRWDVLEHLWRKDPEDAFHAVRRWNDNYVTLYHQLQELVARPTLLVWLSGRRPNDWKPRDLLRKLDWGDFPQLIGARTFERVAALADERFEFITGASKKHPVSRVTGEPCPYFGAGKTLHAEMDYYPSAEDHIELAVALTPWARSVSRRPAPPLVVSRGAPADAGDPGCAHTG